MGTVYGLPKYVDFAHPQNYLVSNLSFSCYYMQFFLNLHFVYLYKLCYCLADATTTDDSTFVEKLIAQVVKNLKVSYIPSSIYYMTTLSTRGRMKSVHI